MKISHCPHEHNSMADTLANEAVKRSCEWIEFDRPLGFILGSLELDRRDVRCSNFVVRTGH